MIDNANNDIANCNKLIEEESIKETPDTEKIARWQQQIQNDQNTINGLRAALVQKDVDPDNIDAAITQMNQAIVGIDAGISNMQANIDKMKKNQMSMKSAIADMEKAKKEMYDAINQMKSKQQLMIDARNLMISMRDDIPGLFEDVEAQYLKEIDRDHEKIEAAYQRTLNRGFRNMFICVAVFNLIGLILLMIYRDDRRKEEDE